MGAVMPSGGSSALRLHARGYALYCRFHALCFGDSPHNHISSKNVSRGFKPVSRWFHGWFHGLGSIWAKVARFCFSGGLWVRVAGESQESKKAATRVLSKVREALAALREEGEGAAAVATEVNSVLCRSAPEGRPMPSEALHSSPLGPRCPPSPTQPKTKSDHLVTNGPETHETTLKPP